MKSTCYCNKIFEIKVYNQKYCSKKCRDKKNSNERYMKHNEHIKKVVSDYRKLNLEKVKNWNKKSLIKFRKRCPDRFNKLMLKGYKRNKNKWTSRRMTLYVFKNFYSSMPKLCKCGSNDKIQIHHDEYPIKIEDIKIEINEGKIYYICKKCHDKK